MKWKLIMPVLAACTLVACHKIDPPYVNEDAATFTEISSTVIGESGAAEITAYDPETKKLFVVTNTGSSTQIDILNLANPAAPVVSGFIDIRPYGGFVNSVYVKDGKLAAAVEGFTKTDPGKAVVFRTTDYSVIKQVPVGAQPDMITFSYDGKYILTANEGEPNNAYTIDPAGTVSIISVGNDYAVTTLDFSSFASRQAALQAKGLRVFGPGASFAQDMEPEYIAISHDSKTAWVTLQENNAIAKIDLLSKTVTDIFPLGFKDYSLQDNTIDPSDRDGGIFLGKWNVKGIYTPDAIAVLEHKGIPHLFTANEGDSREYTAYVENSRVSALTLDPTAFPDAANLKLDARLGRLNVTRTLGDTDNDGDYDQLYALGARSFSIWNGLTGEQVFDSKNDLDRRSIDASRYDDTRSDDKSIEPEGIAIGEVGSKKIAFVGLERANAVAVYDVTTPTSPQFIKMLFCGIGPEGITFVPAKQSPIGKSLVIVSSEVDGMIKVFRTE